jgi:hypothetical protein
LIELLLIFTSNFKHFLVDLKIEAREGDRVVNLQPLSLIIVDQLECKAARVLKSREKLPKCVVMVRVSRQHPKVCCLLELDQV